MEDVRELPVYVNFPSHLTLPIWTSPRRGKVDDNEVVIFVSETEAGDVFHVDIEAKSFDVSPRECTEIACNQLGMMLFDTHYPGEYMGMVRRRAEAESSGNALAERDRMLWGEMERLSYPKVLTVGLISMEATLVLSQELGIVRSLDKPEFVPGICSSTDPNVISCDVVVTKDDFGLGIDAFSDKFIRPAMQWFSQSLHGIKLSAERTMLMPCGVDAAQETFRGVALRTVISDSVPVPDGVAIPHQVKKYYSIPEDVFKVGPCATIMLFSVHKET